MGWFDEQVRQRRSNDSDAFTDAIVNMAGAVLGRKAFFSIHDNRLITQNALDEILKFFHIKSKELPDHVRSASEAIEYLMRPNGIMYRVVKLEEGWHKDCIGPMIIRKKGQESVIALIPKSFSGYRFKDAETGVECDVTRENEKQFEAEAICFYKPLPLRALTKKDLLLYTLGSFSARDLFGFAFAAFAVTALGALAPFLYERLLYWIDQSGDFSYFRSTAVFLLAVIISGALFGVIRNLLLGRIKMKMGLYTESALMMRLISLPAEFFRDFGAGDLASRIQYIELFTAELSETAFSLAFPALFSLVYAGMMMRYEPAMIPILLWMLALMLLLSLLTVWVRYRIGVKRYELSAKKDAMSYALLGGVQKIKLSGAESRAFARWGNLYAQEAGYLYNPPILAKIGPGLVKAIPLFFTVCVYYYAYRTGLAREDYFAFTILLGLLLGAFLPFTDALVRFGDILPLLDMAEPILKAVPEIDDKKSVIASPRGDVEISHLSFRYKESLPYILNDLSLHIRKGEYVAIVGESGCGKSTLLRLLLGFETPTKGAIYYDGKDMKTIDLKSLRSHIGTVMQSSKLFLGDIITNIRITSPDLTMDEAWEAAEVAGIADDIRKMPMGMFTMVGEGIGGISGGQAQRIMIARAVAGKPNLLIFDEATSALDNVTQKNVSDALASLQCTRIVIAHRLSTIKECDRIVLLEGGRIAEDGTYDELIAKGGRFAKLVEAQML